MIFNQVREILDECIDLHARIEALPPNLRRAAYAFLGEFLAAIQAAAHFTFLYKGKEITMLDLTATQQADVALVITTIHGKPAKVDGAPEWKSSNEAVATVVAAKDGLSATILAVNDEGGVCQITAAGDADLGPGVAPFSAFLDVTVAPGKGGTAAVFELVPGAPSEQPPNANPIV